MLPPCRRAAKVIHKLKMTINASPETAILFQGIEAKKPVYSLLIKQLYFHLKLNNIQKV